MKALRGVTTVESTSVVERLPAGGVSEVRDNDALTTLPPRCFVFNYTTTDRYRIAWPKAHLNVQLR